jgi:hypothetical protein
MAQRDRLQSEESGAPSRSAAAGRQVVVDEPAATAAEDERVTDQARALLPALAGGGSPDAAPRIGCHHLKLDVFPSGGLACTEKSSLGCS